MQTLNWTGFQAWARDERSRPGGQFDWIPSSRDVFLDAFGSWSAACLAAGLQPAIARGRRGSGAAPGPGAAGARACAGGIAHHAGAYTDQALIEALRDAAASQPGGPGRRDAGRPLGFVSRAQFNACQHARQARQAARGMAVAAIHPQTVAKRFGGWPQACLAAGLITPAECDRMRRRGRMTRQEAQAALAACLADLHPARLDALLAGSPAAPPQLGSRAYRRWMQAEQAAPRRPGLRLPSFTTIAAQLGSGDFQRAVDRAWQRLASRSIDPPARPAAPHPGAAPRTAARTSPGHCLAAAGPARRGSGPASLEPQAP